MGNNKKNFPPRSQTFNRTLKTLHGVYEILGFSASQIKACSNRLKKIHENVKRSDFQNYLNLAAVAVWQYTKTQMPGVFRLRDICAPFQALKCRVSPSSVMRSYRLIYPKCKHFLEKARPTTSEEYLPYVVGKILFDETIQARLRKRKIKPSEYAFALNCHGANLLERISKKKRGGRNPHVFAVAIAYGADRVYCRLRRVSHVLRHHDLQRITDRKDYSSGRRHWGEIIHHHAMEYLEEVETSKNEFLRRCPMDFDEFIDYLAQFAEELKKGVRQETASLNAVSAYINSKKASSEDFLAENFRIIPTHFSFKKRFSESPATTYHSLWQFFFIDTVDSMLTIGEEWTGERLLTLLPLLRTNEAARKAWVLVCLPSIPDKLPAGLMRQEFYTTAVDENMAVSEAWMLVYLLHHSKSLSIEKDKWSNRYPILKEIIQTVITTYARKFREWKCLLNLQGMKN